MSKLHMYRWVGKFPSKVADGDGNPSGTESFEVTITQGSVKKGIVYEILEGQSPSGNNYTCQVGAQKNGKATFKKATPAELARLSMDIDQLGAVFALRAAVQASQKTVEIRIAPGDLETLKQGNYMLCFAKKVAEGVYNVVWQSYSAYLGTNDFSWTPQYQLFGTNTFKDRITVKASTNLVDIGLGEQSTLNSAGNLGPASSGGPDISITLVNEYGSIHAGVNQISTGIDGTQISTPIYVSEEAVVKGETTLTPVETVLVWFEQNMATSTMFSTSRSKSVEIDLTNANSATRLYKDQGWTTPRLS